MSSNNQTNKERNLAVVTGASSGIGYYLSDECASRGYDLLAAPDEKRTLIAEEHKIKRSAPLVRDAAAL